MNYERSETQRSRFPLVRNFESVRQFHFRRWIHRERTSDGSSHLHENRWSTRSLANAQVAKVLINSPLFHRLLAVGGSRCFDRIVSHQKFNSTCEFRTRDRVIHAWLCLARASERLHGANISWVACACTTPCKSHTHATLTLYLAVYFNNWNHRKWTDSLDKNIQLLTEVPLDLFCRI